MQGLACQGLRVVLSSNAGLMCCKQLSLVFQCLPRTQGIHNRLPNSFTQRDGHEHLNCTCEWICQAYLDITFGFSWYQHDWCPWFDVCLGIYSKGLRSRSFGRYTREKPRSGSSRTPSSHGWPDITCLLFLWYQTWIQVREEGQWSTSYMSMIEFLLQYHCMTVWHCCVFLCIILLSLVWWTSLWMFKCPDRHLLRRRNFNFSGRGFWWIGDTFETIPLFL